MPDLKSLISWRPYYQPRRIVMFLCGFGFAVGLLLLAAFLLLDLSWPLAITCLLLGLLLTPPLGLLTFRFLQFKLYTWKVYRCLTDGEAEYLMPGAFTHVVVHKNLPGKVILIKRGNQAMTRYVGRLGPRKSSASEWAIYRRMKSQNFAVETRFLMRMRIHKVRMLFGSKLVDQAVVKGEERFISDQKLREKVEIYTQQRGVTLSEFLSEHGEHRRRIAEQLSAVVRRMWQTGFIDLDVAMRNYLICVDEKGRPIKNRKGIYDIRCHDYGCVFDIPSFDGAELLHFLASYGEVEDLGRAVLDNASCFVRSLTGRKERHVAELLVPDANWTELRKLFDPAASTLPIQKRLRHHSYTSLLKQTRRALAIAIIQASRGADAKTPVAGDPPQEGRNSNSKPNPAKSTSRKRVSKQGV